MLYLLRQIRRKLLSQDNKVISYLLYAIGEIVLVVIGILIAVQIDDWNENRKKAKLEQKILNEIKVDLQNDLHEIRDEMVGYNLIQKADSALEAFYFTEAPFTDTLGSFVYLIERNPHFNPINGGYQLLKSHGIDLISNDSLRLLINRYYEQSIPYYEKYGSERLQVVLQEFISFNYQNFYLVPVPYFPGKSRKPIDPKVLKDLKWLSIIQSSASLAEVQYNIATRLEHEIIRLKERISQELKSMK